MVKYDKILHVKIYSCQINKIPDGLDAISGCVRLLEEFLDCCVPLRFLRI